MPHAGCFRSGKCPLTDCENIAFSAHFAGLYQTDLVCVYCMLLTIPKKSDNEIIIIYKCWITAYVSKCSMFYIIYSIEIRLISISI